METERKNSEGYLFKNSASFCDAPLLRVLEELVEAAKREVSLPEWPGKNVDSHSHPVKEMSGAVVGVRKLPRWNHAAITRRHAGTIEQGECPWYPRAAAGNCIRAWAEVCFTRPEGEMVFVFFLASDRNSDRIIDTREMLSRSHVTFRFSFLARVPRRFSSARSASPSSS